MFYYTMFIVQWVSQVNRMLNTLCTYFVRVKTNIIFCTRLHLVNHGATLALNHEIIQFSNSTNSCGQRVLSIITPKKEPVWMIFPLDFEIRRFTHTVKFIDSSQISSAVIFSEDREGFFHYFTNVSRMSCDRLRQRLQCNYYIWLLLLSLIKWTSSKMPSNLTLQRLLLQVMDWTSCSMRLPPWEN